MNSNFNFEVGDEVLIQTFNGFKAGKIKKINDTINRIDVDIYVTDDTGSHTISVPHFNITKVKKKEESLEDIKKPIRYNKKGTLECWDVIIDQEMNFLEGSVLKYLWRYKEKGGVDDLKKAKVYIDKMIEEFKK